MFRALNVRVSAVALLALLFLGGCGGGGGSSDDSSGSGGLRTDTCSTLGLQPRIINGTQCETSGSPVVRIDLRLRDGSAALCSGSIISPTHVLSAGHCFPPQTRSAFITVNGARVDGARFFRHPGYTETSQALFKDVAVLELSQPVSLPILPIMTSQPVSSGDAIQIFGFGTTETGSLGVLESGEMRVSDVTSDHLIAAFNGDGSNTCTGDSGGPALLTVNGAVGIVGLTSSGFRADCLAGDRTLFANMQSADYIGFVRSIVPSVRTN